MKKIVIEKVPEGIKVSVTIDTAKKPVEIVLQPGQIGLLCTMLQQAAKSDSFRFEYQP